MSAILSKHLKEYINSFSRNSDPIINEMEKFAEENKIPILEKSSAIFLEQILTIAKPKNFLEIGTAIGYSTIRAARILPKTAKIRSVELSKDNLKIAKHFINKSLLQDRIELFQGDAMEFLTEKKIIHDFIFLDADKEDYNDYLELTLDRLEKGGILFVDNLLWKGYVFSGEVPEGQKKSTEFIKKFNARFLNHPKLNSSLIPVGDGIGLGIKK